MADILDEVLNDAKDEKRLLIFHKVLPVVIICTIIGAATIAGYGWYQKKISAHNQKIGDMFLEIILGEHQDESLMQESLERIIANSENNQAQLAELKIIDNLIDAKKIDQALEKLEDIINKKDYSEITTSFARILWIGIILDKADIPDNLQMKLRDYFQHFTNNDQPFFANATLMKSLFYKKNAQNDLAIQYANIILALDDAPMIIKEQAMAVLSNI